MRQLLLLHDGTLSSLAQCRALGAALRSASLFSKPASPTAVASAAEAVEAHVPLSKLSAMAPAWALALASEVTRRPFLGVASHEAAQRALNAAREAHVDTIIACGRRTAALSIGIKRALASTPGYGPVVNVQILNPRFGSFLRNRYFDAVITPQHDGVQGRNIFCTSGALTWVSPETLAEQRAHETPEETSFLAGTDARQSPRRLVVLLGGSTARKAMEQETVLDDLHDIFLALEGNFELALIVCSRRTPPDMVPLLHALTESSELPVRVWAPYLDPTQPQSRDPLTLQTFNPYRAALARGDAFVVTGDSVSIASDACSTGMPVYVLRDGVDGTKPGNKLWRFQEHLRDKGHVVPAVEDLGRPGRQHRTKDAEEAAAFVLRAI
ncbi:Mitochondrial fission protein ELM1 [Hondaea fermentalgiana]|uniref:Mitochondrial fission protein ELM1 n=1 Tax=Hondaea fermentalgiana TaxID=2315210 RepID=A0A2R5GIZ1_9STRA|nr:Mitochondrial fission protein ELM1 [Hondaea fermentalgiana]|eukprot:GBG30856.1 Mitochondrial fission protein ELM1 [Hondaea fermentalgiana]